MTSKHLRARRQLMLGLEFTLARISRADRITSTDRLWRKHERVYVSSAERTIVDALVTPAWVGGFRHLVDILAMYGSGEDAKWDRLRHELTEAQSGAAFKRLGYLAERFWPARTDLIEMAAGNRSKGNIKLDPDVPTRGGLNKRWGLWINTDDSELLTP